MGRRCPGARGGARAGAIVVDGGLSSFLAHVQLLDANVEPGAAVEVIVIGGGRAYVDDEVRAAALDARVVAVDERAPDELDAAIGAAAAAHKPVVLVAGTEPSVMARPLGVDGAQLLSADLRHPEHLRALLVALAAPAVESESSRTRPRIDKELAARVRGESEGVLADHDAKRLLKAYGVRVTRQAPTNTPTGAAKLAKQIGVPASSPSVPTSASPIPSPTSSGWPRSCCRRRRWPVVNPRR